LPLRWAIQDVKDWKDLWEDLDNGRPGPSERLKPFVDALVSHCGLVIGIPRITQDNWKEAYLRAFVATEVLGASPIVECGEDEINRRPPKPEEVHRCIGLSTNGKEFDRKKFADRILDNLESKTDFSERLGEQKKA
jgi:hypothetical protein